MLRAAVSERAAVSGWQDASWQNAEAAGRLRLAVNAGGLALEDLRAAAECGKFQAPEIAAAQPERIV